MPGRIWTDDKATRFVQERFPGTTPAEPFPGYGLPWQWVCSEGHDAKPTFASIYRLGTHLCQKCAAIGAGARRRSSHDDAVLEVQARFAGAVPETDYPGLVDAQWAWTCPVGHPTTTTLNRIRTGKRLCHNRACGGGQGRAFLSHDEAAARMLALYPKAQIVGRYKGSAKPWALICERGHECSPRPRTVWSGQGLCRRCEALDRGDALRHTHESAARVLEARAPGAKPLEPYPGKVDLKWRMLCPEGHECAVTLALVTMHFRVSCAVCAHHGFDPSKPAWLYFLPGVRNGFDVWQVGITNNLPQRLRKHARSGFRVPAAGARMLFFEDGREAARMERLVLGRLRERGLRSLESLWGEQGRFDGYREAFLACDAPAVSLSEVLRLAGTRRPGSAVWQVAEPPPSRRKRPTSPSASGR